jgi:hypothetical protein
VFGAVASDIHGVSVIGQIARRPGPLDALCGAHAHAREYV